MGTIGDRAHRRGTFARVAALLCPLLVAACALPVPLQVASWVVDGVALMATGKSMPEHGLSAVTEQDCAFLRGALGGSFCIDNVVGATAIAAFDQNPADSASLMVATQNSGDPRRFDVAVVASLFIGADQGGDSAGLGASIADVFIPDSIVVAAVEPGSLSDVAAAAEINAFVLAETEVAELTDDGPAADGPDEAEELAAFETAAGDDESAAEQAGPGSRAMLFVVTDAGLAELHDLQAMAEDAAARQAGSRTAGVIAGPTTDEPGLAELVDVEAALEDGASDQAGTGGEVAFHVPHTVDPALAETIFEQPAAGALPEATPEGDRPTPEPEAFPEAADAVSEPGGVEVDARMYDPGIGMSALSPPAAAPPDDQSADAGNDDRAPMSAARQRRFYFVVGSFEYLGNARRVAVQHAELKAAVVTARLDGRRIYRVVVGPFGATQRQAGRRSMIKAGITDFWAISLDPTDWTLAGLNTDLPPGSASTTLADLGRR